MSQLFNSASDIWNFLETEGGLEIGLYDAELVGELRNKLGLPSTGDFGTLLGSISNEDFIVAFFQTIQPYVKMMSDLLCMFEKAGANQTNRNLDISFDFNKDLPKLEFNLSNFKKWVEIWEKVSGIYLVNQWDSSTIWKLNKALREHGDNLQNITLQNWLQQYDTFKKGVWPDFPLPIPCSGDPDLDKTLAKVWRIWNKIVTESSKYGKQRIQPREPMAQESLNDAVYNDLQEENIIWTQKDLCQIDSDNWAGTLAKGAYSKAEKISFLDPPERRIAATELRKELEEIFNQLPKIEVEGEILVRNLQEFLQLPLWKYRYELYSVWISTQVLNALEDYTVRIHHVNGTLKFSFSGTHLATVDDFEPRLHIWTELRSPLENPTGKSRVKAIQPDYSLVADPITSPDSSVLVIECKQYLKSSKKNFSDALSDYAKGRPNAHIVLVNYGTAKQDILDKVDPTVKNRTSLIGMMRPNSIAAQDEFKQLVKNVLPKSYLFKDRKPTFNDLTKIKSANLKWGNVPQDLDLHLRIETVTNTYHIRHSDKGNNNNKPWAFLREDMRFGNSVEVIDIGQCIEGKYHFAVHNYSKDFVLADCDAIFSLSNGNQELILHCPITGEGDWWDILVFDTSTNQFEIINKIIPSLW